MMRCPPYATSSAPREHLRGYPLFDFPGNADCHAQSKSSNFTILHLPFWPPRPRPLSTPMLLPTLLMLLALSGRHHVATCSLRATYLGTCRKVSWVEDKTSRITSSFDIRCSSLSLTGCHFLRQPASTKFQLYRIRIYSPKLRSSSW